MGKQARQEAAAARQPRPPPPAPPVVTETLPLTGPLFGVTAGKDGKMVAVRFIEGRVEALTPTRGGKHTGEGAHFAIRRALDAFKASVLGRRA